MSQVFIENSTLELKCLPASYKLWKLLQLKASSCSFSNIVCGRVFSSRIKRISCKFLKLFLCYFSWKFQPPQPPSTHESFSSQLSETIVFWLGPFLVLWSINISRQKAKKNVWSTSFAFPFCISWCPMFANSSFIYFFWFSYCLWWSLVLVTLTCTEAKVLSMFFF